MFLLRWLLVFLLKHLLSFCLSTCFSVNIFLRPINDNIFNDEMFFVFICTPCQLYCLLVWCYELCYVKCLVFAWISA